MSIHGALQRAHDKGLLDYVAVEESDPVERVFMYGERIRELFEEPFTGPGGSEREVKARELSAALQSFVRGETVSLCFRDHEHVQAMFGRLESDRFPAWDFRSRKSKPSLRLLGGFAAPDIFVALDWWPRFRKAAWSDKEPLLTEERWADAIEETERLWRNILLGKQPVSGDQVEKYVIRKYDLV